MLALQKEPDCTDTAEPAPTLKIRWFNPKDIKALPPYLRACGCSDQTIHKICQQIEFVALNATINLSRLAEHTPDDIEEWLGRLMADGASMEQAEIFVACELTGLSQVSEIMLDQDTRRITGQSQQVRAA